MEAAIYSTKDFEKEVLAAASLRHGLTFRYINEALSLRTVGLCKGCEVAVVFAGDDASGLVLEALAVHGVRYLALRSAGYDNVDLQVAKALGMSLANVPEYSPYAIAEHALALLLALNRKLIRADRQVHAYNFTVGGLVGFDLHGKTIGIIGTGRFGGIFARILHGFGCKLLGFDLNPNAQLEGDIDLRYVDLQTLATRSDVISIHTALTPETHHLINATLIGMMKPGMILINTSRGAVVHTADIIHGLQSGVIGAFGTDVYEHEKGVFFYDRSQNLPDDPMLHHLLQMPNVLITPHQAFATNEAIENIAETTCINISCWAKDERSPNELI